VLAGETPFAASTPVKIRERVLAGDMDPLTDDDFSAEAVDVLKLLLVGNPDERLGRLHGCQEIMDHPFFAALDWSVPLWQQRSVFVPEVCGELAFTRYCHCQYGIVHGTWGRSGGGVVYCAIDVQ